MRASFSLGNAGGEALWSLTLPPSPDLAGTPFFAQAIVFDPAANPKGLVVSNGIAGTVGAR